MENKKTFGSYIKTKRNELNLTQKEFADALYVTESAVSKWERGLSYPDITLIIQICNILGVSEHELLTASEDVQTRNQEKLAKRYLTLIKRFKIAQFILYGIPLVTCFIVNLATQQTLSWFFIVLAALALSASLTLLPVFTEKKRGIITLGGFTGTLLALLAVCAVYTGGNWFVMAAVSVVFGLSVVFLPFVLRGIFIPEPFGNHKALLYMAANTLLLFALLLIAAIYTGGGWFFTAAVPITLFSLIIPWSFMFIIRYLKLRGLFRAAGCLAVMSIYLYVYRGFIDMILGEPYRYGFNFNFADWSSVENVNGNIDAIIFFSVIGLAIIFTVAGVIRETLKHKGD